MSKIKEKYIDGSNGTNTQVLTTDGTDASWQDASGGGASQLSDLSDVPSATNTNRYGLMANGTTGYLGRALVEADISDLGSYQPLASVLTNTTASFTTALASNISTNNSKNTNVSTALSQGTRAATTYGITSDGGANDIILPEATTSLSGVLSSTKFNEIVANTNKATNVSTNLSEGTSTTTTVAVNSSDGSNATLASASTSRAGLLTKAKFDEIVANTNKTTNQTHTGEVTGATALTIADNIVDEANMKISNAPTNDQVLTADSAVTGGWKWAAGGISEVKDDTTPQLGGSLDLNSKSLTSIETAGESLVAGNLCYLKSDGKYWKSDASAAATCSTDILLCNASISADATGEFIEFGKYTTSGLTAGSIYYASETAGAITLTAPTTASAIVRIIGYAQSTTVLKFKPGASYIEI